MRQTHSKSILRRKALGEQRAEVAYIIVHELKKRKLSMSEFARRIGVALALVSLTINGHKHSPRVLDALHDIGIDPALLHDPRPGRCQQSDGMAAHG